MSFSRFNGWDPGLREGTVRGQRPVLGELDPSWTNRPQAYRRGRLQEWSGTTPLLDPGCADTLEAMLDGRGHHIPLDGDLYSTAGLVPQGGAGTFTFPGYVAERPVHGRSHLSLTAGTIIWNPGFHDGKWTVMYWRSADLGFGYGLAEHIVVRSDGAKWLDGVRADATTTTEMTVSNGAVSFGVEEYDDIVLLPYAACAEAVEAFHLWTTAHMMTAYIPMLDIGREVEANVAATVAGTVAFTPGQVGQAADFQDAAARLAYGTSVNFDIASVGDVDGFAVELWINPDTLAADAVLLDHRTAGNGWTLQVASDGSVNLRVTRATTDTEAYTGAGAVVTGAWTHIAATMDPSTLRASIYINGTQQVLSTDDAGVGALDSDTAAVLYVGNNSGSTNALDGRLEEVRIMQRAALSTEIEERYLLGLDGVAPPVRHPYSDLPYLDMSGDIVGGRTVEVLGQVQQHNVTQHGSAGAWVSNAREVAGTMRLRRPRSRRRLSAPDVGWVMDSRYVSGAVLRPIAGPFNGTLVSTTVDGREGPIGHGQSIGFASAEVTLTDALVDSLTGLGKVSGVAWVRRSTSGSVDTVLSFTAITTTAKIHFSFNGSNVLVLGVRALSGESQSTVTGVATVTDNEWHCVGFVIDLAEEVGRLYLDGVLDDEDALLNVTQGRFGDGVGSAHEIGNDPFSLDFDGDIAMVGLFWRRLTDDDFLSIYEAGLEGYLR